MAENSSSISAPPPNSNKPLLQQQQQKQNPSASGDSSIVQQNAHQSAPSISSPQIPPSPSISPGDFSNHVSSPLLQQQHQQQPQQQQQQHQLSQSIQLQHQHQLQLQRQQQQQLMGSGSAGLQIQQSLQRTGTVPRLSQIQQQLGTTAAANVIRQQMYASQMNLGAVRNQIQQQQQQQNQRQQQQQQQQQQQLVAAAAAVAGMSRAGMMSQASGQLPMLPSQTAQHFNLQSQMLGQPRQKGLVQGAQFQAGNSSGQALQGMQSIEMMNALGLNGQMRANGPLTYAQQRFAQGQTRQQQLSQQATLASPQQNLPDQSLQRTSSVGPLNPQMSGLTQNGQSPLMQATLSQQQQQWLKHIQTSMGTPGSPSYLLQQQRQQQNFLPQQLSSSQLHPKTMGLSQQQISQLVQPQLVTQQHQNLIQQQQQIQQLQQFQQQQQQQQQQHQQVQSPRMTGPAIQRSISLTSSQPETLASGTTMTGGSSNKGTEATNQLLGKRKIHDLVLQVDPLGKLDPEVEDLLLDLADGFIDSVTTFACNIAKHRKSSTLEAKDVLLHLEKNWHLTIPGFTKEEQHHQKKLSAMDAHKRHLEIIKELMDSQQPEKDKGDAKGMNNHVAGDLSSEHSLKLSPSSEQLSFPAVTSQMMHKFHQF